MRIHAEITRQFGFDCIVVQRSNSSLPVFTDWVPYANGTVESGNPNSAGQLHFDKTVSREITALEPYVGYIEINHTTNDVNSVFSSGLANGYNPTIDIVPLDGEDITKDMAGYITIGIETESSPSLSGSETRGRGGGGGVGAAPSGSRSAFFSGGTPSATIEEQGAHWKRIQVAFLHSTVVLASQHGHACDTSRLQSVQ